jgi:signal transduction histidine kinase
MELIGQRRDGTEFPVEVAVSSWRSGQRRFFTGIARDISRRKAAEVDLQRRADELGTLAEVSRALRSATTVDEMLPIALAKTAEVTGAAHCLAFLVDPLAGDMVLRASHPRNERALGVRVPMHVGITGRVMLTGEPHVSPRLASDPYVSPPVGHADGVANLGSAMAMPLRERDRCFGVLHVLLREERAVGSDEMRLLTAIAEIAGNALDRAMLLETLETRVDERTRELAAANLRLTELDRLKSKFVADVSHELRTPVSNLRLYLHLLERGQADKRERYLSVLSAQTTRLANLIDDILNLGRLELEPGLEMLAVDLNEIARHVVDEHAARAEDAGLDLVFVPCQDLPPVRSDRNQLAQVVSNLVGNAINYTETGRIWVRTEHGAGRAKLTVADTGRGIDAADLPHVFDRFYRGRSVSQLDVPGTGLGLAIVKEIVDLHGGQIDIHAEPGRGTSFNVWLPLA